LKKVGKIFCLNEKSRTFASANEETISEAIKKKSSLKDLHRQWSSTRSGADVFRRHWV